MDPGCQLSQEEKWNRYRKHRNDVLDPGYQNFVKPVYDAVLSSFSSNDKGLDFGCGDGPVISYLLEKKGFNIDLYDPCFRDNTSYLLKEYDFIILSEVMEHFEDPSREFKLLFSLLKPGGKIFCLTELISDAIDLEKWNYLSDETHVFFYDERTLEYIAKRFGYSMHSVNGRLIVFSK